MDNDKQLDELPLELIDKALGGEADNYKAYDGYVAEWLKSQMEEGRLNE